MTRCDDASDRTADDAGLSRRTILRGAAAGFAATASGLLLPDHDDEAAAREGALDGRLGGRHGNKRRDRDNRHRDKKRDHGDKKRDRRGDDGPPPGRGLFRNTALTLDVGAYQNYPFDFTITYFFRIKNGLDDYGPWVRATSGTNRYAPDRFRIGVLVSAQGGAGVGRDLFVDVRNLSYGLPRGSAFYGEGLDPTRNRLGHALLQERGFGFTTTPSGTYGDEVSISYNLKERPPFPPWRSTASLGRMPDSDNFIEFKVDVSGS